MSLVNRRKFVQSLAATALAGSLPLATSADQEKRVPVVDTHIHCFAGKDSREFPYHAKAPYQPGPALTPETLLERMKQAGVDYAVIVHPEPYQDDHRYLEHCLKVGKERFKGTCLFFAEQGDSIARMKELVQRNPRQIVALRVHAYAPERLPPFGKPELRQLWKAAADLGLAIQLHFEPRYAQGFEPLIKEFAKTPVIIDHLGRPFQGKPEEHAAVVRWSRYENTIMKLSSLPEPRQYPHREIGPIVQTLVEAWTPARLIYGGGFGEMATGESYRATRERLRGFLSKLSASEQGQVLGGNAARLFGFPAV